MSRPYDFAVYIGRFQPFHGEESEDGKTATGHLGVVKHGLEIADRVLMLVGSSNVAPTTRNPWSYKERKRIIELAVERGDNLDRVIIRPLPDSQYDEQAWINSVQAQLLSVSANFVRPRVALLGNKRDHSSYYLDNFPSWSFEPTDDCGISATQVRKLIFEGQGREVFGSDSELSHLVASTTIDFLRRFVDSAQFTKMREDTAFLKAYREEWGEGPHLTADAVVVKSGHVLTIRRGSGPGAGQRAIPGGFINKNERFEAASKRELLEETGLNLTGTEPKGHDVFDDPHRSDRGRIITQAYLYDLGNGPLPPVQGKDDAASAEWLPIPAVKVDEFFEDHAAIVGRMLRFL